MPTIPLVLPELANAQNRETRFHFLDCRIDPSAGTPEIHLLGDGMDSLSREVERDTASTKSVTGRATITDSITGETIPMDPLPLRDDDPVSELMSYLDGKQGDAIRRTYYEAKFDGKGSLIDAFKCNAHVAVTRFGGDASLPDSVAVTLHTDLVHIEQNFTQDPATKEFTFTDVAP